MTIRELTGDDIFARLKNSDRWKVNNQPSIYLATAIFEQLPVIRLSVNHDRLQVEFSRDLAPMELWLIDKLTPDNAQRDERQIDLWWD